jgi:hypothetical protein
MVDETPRLPPGKEEPPSNATVTSPLVQKEASKFLNKRDTQNFITFDTAISLAALIVLITVAISFFGIKYAISNGYIEGIQSKVVVLNTGLLVDTQTRLVMESGKGNPEFIKTESERFARDFKSLSEQYRKAGYLIVQSEAMVSYPNEANVTQDFIKAIATVPLVKK